MQPECVSVWVCTVARLVSGLGRGFPPRKYTHGIATRFFAAVTTRFPVFGDLQEKSTFSSTVSALRSASGSE